MKIVTVRASSLQANDILVSQDSRNRRVRAVFESSFTDGPNRVIPRRTTFNKVYVVVPSTRGRGLEMLELNSSQRVSVKRKPITENA